MRTTRNQAKELIIKVLRENINNSNNEKSKEYYNELLTTILWYEQEIKDLTSKNY